MTLREHIQVRRVTRGMVQQVELGNKTAVTWVPGTRAVKLRYDRAWLKLILGQQSLRVTWGLSDQQIDKTANN